MFELFDPRADRGLAHAQSEGGMTKVQMLGYGQCLNQGHEWNAMSQCSSGCGAHGAILN
jgi:hypothetical protein